MNKKFSEDYSFMQESYVLPDARELMKKNLKIIHYQKIING